MNKRIFIQKKSQFDVHSKKVTKEIQNLVTDIECKVFVIYDLFEITDSQLEETLFQVFADPVTDIVHHDLNSICHPELVEGKAQHYFAVEPLPGQFDQRADSADQCLHLLGVAEAKVKSGYLYMFENVSESDLEKVKNYLINPIESREKDLNELSFNESTEIKPVPTVQGFIDFDSNQLENLHKEFGFSMGMDDLEFIQDHFKSIQRNPTETELKVLDTYWSDHCRHTTFETEITEVKFENQFQETLQRTFDYYLNLRQELGITKPIRLMDMATIMGKYLSKTGKVNNIDVSEEINACSIVVPIDVDGVEEEWLLQFKNETHNHPTEVEPFGGASTCVGGAIRDPLSGRAYVFQAMRVTGSANPLEKIEDTLPGKLPQRKITKEAANGYSSYGNQIGLATTFVKEIYDEGYKAKRMEVGFVAGAVKKDWVRREEPLAGDKVILLGGRTGRDGVGGATGSSKTHDGQKIEELSSEVQKGNAIVERKIQRLFRNKEVLALIKKCNDFGAGGVSVAIGEIARGVNVNLDTLPLKYLGLNGTEIALSESQERMAVVVEAKDVEKFIQFAEVENLEATMVAEVTSDDVMTMWWKGTKIVELDRKFLDTNGVRKQAKARVEKGETLNPFEAKEFNKENFIQLLKELNHASQKGMVEMFDNNVGRSTILNAYGGKTMSSPEDISVQKFPTDGFTHAVSMASFGYNPVISRWSPYHGAYFAVLDSVAKIVAGGGNYQEIRLTFQEYFERLREDADRWGKPFAALLGSIEAQRQLEIPAIGGKDSMSGSYQDIDVPPTLISFAVSPNHSSKIKSATLQKQGSKLSVLIPNLTEDHLVEESNMKSVFNFIYSNNAKIHSAATVKFGGIAETLANMAFGNEIGFTSTPLSDQIELMKFYPAAIILEHSEELNIPTELQANYQFLGTTNSSSELNFNGISVSISEAKNAWNGTFEELFPTNVRSTKNDRKNLEILTSDVKNPKSKIVYQKSKIVNPKVFIPSFPGTNSEYDSAKAFRKEGANTEIIVFKNLSEKDIEETVDAYAKAIDNAQIMFIPGGFSAADEPDGSGKFIATVLRNEKIKDSVHRLLDRGGLVLGICNGFQGLIKSGLLPYGEIRELEEDTPTLTFNEIGRHITQIARIRVADSHSPWLKGMAGQEYWIPFSHGEGRFVADEPNLRKLYEQNQIATQYIDLDGNISLERPYNPNGSVNGIEGIVSPCGKVFGRMGHPERFEEGLFQNIPDMEVMNIFKNGVEYFK
ncbi:phosphoribosylformylglycinamidine synthase [Moheibacter stercoris]|uniref:Phosphoribosylformylglycinamidine synthase n=1 Tax=Moheibacter stercoris TaxID=1628251 RepID=A0ABV2LUM6_9FLAO